MVVPLRSQARLRHSLLHWAYYGLFRALRAAFVRPKNFFTPLDKYIAVRYNRYIEVRCIALKGVKAR